MCNGKESISMSVSSSSSEIIELLKKHTIVMIKLVGDSGDVEAIIYQDRTRNFTTVIRGVKIIKKNTNSGNTLYAVKRFDPGVLLSELQRLEKRSIGNVLASLVTRSKNANTEFVGSFERAMQKIK